MKNRTCINYHGLGGAPSPICDWMLKKYFGFTNVISEHFDFEAEWYKDKGKSFFEAELKKVKENNVDLIIGNSFGGYIAYQLSKATGIDVLLINPAIDRSRTKTHIGWYDHPKYNTESKVEIFWGEKDYHVLPEIAQEYLAANNVKYDGYFIKGMEHNISVYEYKFIVENSKLINKGKTEETSDKETSES